MPSFASRRYTPDRLRSLSKPTADDDVMEDILHTSTGSPKDTASLLSSSPTLVPSDGSLLDYFDLPSPPSTPHRPTHSLSYSSLSSASFPSPPHSHTRPARSPGSLSLSSASSAGSPPLSTTSFSASTPTPPFRWPTLSQRIHTHRLPTRTRSRSRSTTSSSSLSDLSSTTTVLAPTHGDADVEMGGLGGTGTGSGMPPPVRPRRTPYYPPNASRNGERARVYMNRGPHYVPNWTPLGSLPRHVQLQIEERMVKFTAG